ncbi:hypothetical protein V494_08036 [Pseudogymnoascus sp. VKM F-4513 (FW-928)]|nr:hypothetical protein V494_08036 [Pseudogymnoascus sp. VKM F-4513 (FW-928)]
MRQQKAQLGAEERPGLCDWEEVHPAGDVGLVRIAIPADGDVQAVAECPHDGAVDEVEGVRDASEVDVEAHLEEGLEPGHVRNRGYHRHRREEEVEPLEVEDCLRLEEGEVVPPADNEEVEEDELLPGLEDGEPFWELVLGREQVEVAQQHASEEHGEEGPIHDVHAVVDHAQLAP